MKLRISGLLAIAVFVFALAGIFVISATGLAQNAYITNGSGTVSVINTATNAVTATISVVGGSFGVAVSPDGSKVYVASIVVKVPGTVSVIDAATNAVTATISVGFSP